jgi:hypothetical protein
MQQGRYGWQARPYRARRRGIVALAVLDGNAPDAGGIALGLKRMPHKCSFSQRALDQT